jgi:tetratricopeptide (TPR) repeat protein
VLALLGEEEEVEEILRNIHFINWDHYGENNPELLPGLERLHDWFLQARPPGSAMADYGDYRAMIQLSEEMAAVSETTRGLPHPATARAYRRLGEAQFQMARYMAENEMAAFLALGFNPMEATADVQAIARAHYDAGRKAFDRYLESVSANPENSPLDQARARVELGDWFLVFGRSRLARRHYEDAFLTLSRSEEYANLADSYLGRPKLLYFMAPEAEPPSESQSASGDVQFDVKMTVTRSGDARDVEIVNPPEGLSEEDLEAIERQVRKMTFRPALKAGEVVTTEDFIWRYESRAATADSG